MKIVLKGGIFDRRKSPSEEVFLFNCEDSQFFMDFDPRSITATTSGVNPRDYSYIIRTTNSGFDYGVQFLNRDFGPRGAAVAIFLSAGWMIPNDGEKLKNKLEDLADKTKCAIAKHVMGYDDGSTQGRFQNPLSDEDINRIAQDCQFQKVEEINVKDELHDKKIFLTGVYSVKDFFENPYQKGQISSRGTIFSAWDGITRERFPNDIVKSADLDKNYMYKPLGAKFYLLRLRGSNVELKYRVPITNSTISKVDTITGSDSEFLKYSGNRVVCQKTAEEAGISFRYRIKIDCILVGAFGYTKKTHCLQALNDILEVDYNEINNEKQLTCPDGERISIIITENDIKIGRMKVPFKAIEQEFVIKVSGKKFDSTEIKVKIDTASPAYDTISKLHQNQCRVIDLSKADKKPINYIGLCLKCMWGFLIAALLLLVVFLINLLSSDGSETPDTQQPTQTIVQNNVNNIEVDKNYLKNNDIWKMADLKTNEAKAFYQDVMDWNIGEIRDNKNFGDCAGNKTLNGAVTDSDQTKKHEIIKYLKKSKDSINLRELHELIEKINSGNNSTTTDSI
ncbi:MAG: hypothetical protein PUD39_04675 [Bacteroidales bacterium]|nr:hypothetical protein [Bacteroidales bacterium]